MTFDMGGDDGVGAAACQSRRGGPSRVGLVARRAGATMWATVLAQLKDLLRAFMLR
jgi:hypothetical protein